MTNTERGTARFNVSDALDVPLRGFLLRLRRLDGDVSVRDIASGSRLRLRSPNGEERVVTISDKSLTGGRNGAERFEKTGQMDVIISSEDAYAEGRAVGIGWTAEGPLRDSAGALEKGDVKPYRRPEATRRGPGRDSATGGWPFNPPGGR